MIKAKLTRFLLLLILSLIDLITTRTRSKTRSASVRRREGDGFDHNYLKRFFLPFLQKLKKSSSVPFEMFPVSNYLSSAT